MSSLLKRMSRSPQNSKGKQTSNPTPTTIPECHTYRVGVVGASKTGKTRLSILFSQGVYSDTYTYEETIEDVYSKEMTLNMKDFYEQQGVEDSHHSADITVKLEIIDTSGNSENEAMFEIQWSSMDGFLLMYDATNRQSLTDLETYYKKIVDARRDAKLGSVPIVLVCSKIDVEQPLWSSEEGAKLARQWGCQLIRISSQSDIGIHECFELLVHQIIAQKFLRPDESILLSLFGDNSLDVGDKDHKRKSISNLFKRVSTTFRN